MTPFRAYDCFFGWPYPLAFIWGILVILSLSGWGYFLGGRLLPIEEVGKLGWGLAATWGMAAYLIFSGPLLLLSIFSEKFVLLFLLVGWALWLWRTIRGNAAEESRQVPPTFILKIAFIILCLFALLAYADAAGSYRYNGIDDLTAYFGITRMALDTGTFFDPFNFRLIGSTGGQSILTALVVPFLPWRYVHLLDIGIAGLIILGLIQGMAAGGDARVWRICLLIMGVALTFPMPRNNTSSELTGTIFFVSLLEGFKLASGNTPLTCSKAILLGGLMAATATLRGHYVFAIVFLSAGFFGWRLWTHIQSPHKVAHEILMTLFLTVALSLPWLLVTYRSSGAFLYPLVPGTQRPEFDTFNLHLGPIATLNFITGFFGYAEYGFFFLPLCFLWAGRERQLLLFLALAVFSISLLLISQMTNYLYYDIYRYLCPISLAFALFTAGMVAQQSAGRPLTNGAAWRILFFAGTLVTVIGLQASEFLKAPTKVLAQLVLPDAKPPPIMDYYWNVDASSEADREYMEAFAHIPKNSKTLIALDYTYKVDYRGRLIFNIDIPGAASPSPGLPYFRGCAALKDYLKAQGIYYIAHVPFDHACFLHNRPRQKEILKSDVALYRTYGKYELDFINNVDELAKTSSIIYDSPTIRVIRLDN